MITGTPRTRILIFGILMLANFASGLKSPFNIPTSPVNATSSLTSNLKLRLFT